MVKFKIIKFTTRLDKKTLKQRNIIINNNIFHVVVKKKDVKKSCDRNKIKRQIRYLVKNDIKNILIMRKIYSKTFIFILEKIDLDKYSFQNLSCEITNKIF